MSEISTQNIKGQLPYYQGIASSRFSWVDTTKRVCSSLNQNAFPEELATEFIDKCKSNISKLETVSEAEISSLVNLTAILKAIPELALKNQESIGLLESVFQDDIVRFLYLELLTGSPTNKILEPLDELIKEGKHEEASLLATFLYNCLGRLNDHFEFDSVTTTIGTKLTLLDTLRERFDTFENRHIKNGKSECSPTKCMGICSACGYRGRFHVVYNSSEKEHLEFLKGYGKLVKP